MGWLNKTTLEVMLCRAVDTLGPTLEVLLCNKRPLRQLTTPEVNVTKKISIHKPSAPAPASTPAWPKLTPCLFACALKDTGERRIAVQKQGRIPIFEALLSGVKLTDKEVVLRFVGIVVGV